jgi:predicted dehydrogenase
MSHVAVENSTLQSLRPARIGMIGSDVDARQFLRALQASASAEVVAIADTLDGGGHDMGAFVPDAVACRDFEALLRQDLDGVILATPTSRHVAQAEAAIARGFAVFCQRPLGRDVDETVRVIDAARGANVLLGVDMTFRATEAMRVLRSTVQAGELGDIFAVEATFHNAGDPENRWALSVEDAGGGCMMDQGMSMIDLALWTLGFPRVTNVTSRLYSRGDLLDPSMTDAPVAEDYATAMLDLDTGATLRVTCSWNLQAGESTHIELAFYGTEGGGTFRNVNGSRYDFAADLLQGTHRHSLAKPDDWQGRTAASWAYALARGGRYDPWVEGVADVAAAVDRILGKRERTRH